MNIKQVAWSDPGLWQEKKFEQYKSDIALYKKNQDKLIIYETQHDNKFISTLNAFIFFGIAGTLWIFTSLYESLNIYIASLVAIAFLELCSLDLIKINIELKKIKKRIKRARKQEEDICDRLTTFEKPIYDYCLKQVEDFFHEKLDGKKASSKKFQESLLQFSSMVEEFSNITSNLVTYSKPITISHYKTYLAQRQVNHNLHAEKDSPELASMRNFAANLIKLQEPTA
jgi:hypothetical protein